MLNSLIEKLGTFFSANFVIGYFFPVVLFIAINGVLLDRTTATFHAWVEATNAASPTALTLRLSLITASIFVLTFILSTASAFLREALEGRLMPRAIAARLRAVQQTRFDKLQERLLKIQRLRNELWITIPRWRTELAAARRQGETLSLCQFTGFSDTTKTALERVRDNRAFGDLAEPADFLIVKTELEIVLKGNDASIVDPESADFKRSENLDKCHSLFSSCLQSGLDRVDLEVTTLFNRIQGEFPGHDVEPTAVGNIARTIVSYAHDRYRFNSEFFWTRLQKVVREKDGDFYKTLLDAKAQLDFTVITYWLLLLSTVFWLSVYPFIGFSIVTYAALAFAFPAACWIAYRLIRSSSAV